MRYPAARKEQTRARIVEAAGRVFRRQGYEGAGLDRVMEEAGLTSGAFYAHFESKEALLAEALVCAGEEAGVAHETALEGRWGADWLGGFLDRYLSTGHLREVEGGCPLPALVSEAARASGPVKDGFESLVRGLAGKLESRLERASGVDDPLLAVVALCVGGISLSRAVGDEAFASRILEASRRAAREILGADGMNP